MGASACLFRGAEHCLWALYVSAVLFQWPTGNLAAMCRGTFWHRPRERKWCRRGAQCENVGHFKAGKQPLKARGWEESGSGSLDRKKSIASIEVPPSHCVGVVLFFF